MAFFGRNKDGITKEDKRALEYLEKKGLTNLESDITKQVNNVASDLAGLGLMKAGLALSFAKSEEQAKIGYASAQVEQNWIIIKQQDEILKELKKLNKK